MSTNFFNFFIGQIFVTLKIIDRTCLSEDTLLYDTQFVVNTSQMLYS